MSVSKKDVEHVAKLARLGLTEEEKELFTTQLSSILDYAKNLNKLDTKNVPPTSHAIPMKNVLREDQVIPCTNTQDIVANGPEIEDNMFKVPRIME
ncbi:Asp-tRNA(Asn)/Glu-tRNA(Gln) amidotransferase GatCAB subunit C [Candidatus Saganbacteria bacterium CG08_land_8_20_14_0_20_45_16]|uniref:Aspartyl/glutamyl-tRNA(Asn/Gln) amidotransferase subunit C n=1 Tax=Candidatus Saganbacteria bacterium CG08_land_8_20_14_0_20_45_16 TaxID=2014293 RepID=A0A2H0Y3F9_UNCSA|nr:MAG: Asp-tRNA(Asn)/Glu-tRNA(Gln) amidotransferase GatCAB subunit C [Candidatus Saganbacteria bacterium CG08_land_8_20_14_0_20_45_16]